MTAKHFEKKSMVLDFFFYEERRQGADKANKVICTFGSKIFLTACHFPKLDRLFS